MSSHESFKTIFVRRLSEDVTLKYKIDESNNAFVVCCQDSPGQLVKSGIAGDEMMVFFESFQCDNNSQKNTETMILDSRGELVKDETGTWCGLDSFLFRKKFFGRALVSHSVLIDNRHMFIFSGAEDNRYANDKAACIKGKSEQECAVCSKTKEK